MCHRYVSFITDEYLLTCIAHLYDSYLNAKKEITKKKFYENKIDTFKLLFDSKFFEISEEDIIKSEILRQIDKSINNFIGTFHEEILCGIDGYEGGRLLGYDIKATDNSLFADLKNKHNTANSNGQESLYQRLKVFADNNRNSKCYWVQILAKSSFHKLWAGRINGKEYRHSQVYKISGDRFYALLTKKDDALFELYKNLPVAIHDYLQSINEENTNTGDSVLFELKNAITGTQRSILDQIASENYPYYSGFKDL